MPDGLVKIGQSNDVRRRFLAMPGARFAGAFRGAEVRECDLLERFKGDCERGEFFRPTAEVMALVNAAPFKKLAEVLPREVSMVIDLRFYRELFDELQRAADAAEIPWTVGGLIRQILSDWMISRRGNGAAAGGEGNH